MPLINVPYSTTGLTFDVPDANFAGTFESSINDYVPALDGAALVQEALDNPIASPAPAQLAKGAKNAVIIASDHTRPVPSKILLPPLLKRLRDGNPDIDITILVATGMHRPSTKAELVAKFGDEIFASERIVIHDSRDESKLAFLGTLPSGGELWINKIAAEADLLMSEGFIEPHFFAGFSGGRKSVLPGIAGYKTVLANHCSRFIQSPLAITGNLEGNPIHKDMLWAAQRAKLRFILNVVINSKKQIMKAFAGDALLAHKAGCDFLRPLCQVNLPEADIVITSNGGHPLDQNLYQTVKGMTAAEAGSKPGSVIIIASACGDGHGGEQFHRFLAEAPSPAALLASLENVPQNKTQPDQWESQILARILAKHTVILVSDKCPPEIPESMHIPWVKTPAEAIKLAFRTKGANAKVAVIQDGVSVIASHK